MFEKIAKELRKALGKTDDSLIAVDNVNGAISQCKVLNIVIRKNHYLWWRQPGYTLTSFSVAEISNSNVTINIPTTIVPVGNYKDNREFKVSGKISTKLLHKYGIGASTKDDIGFHYSCNSLVKESIDLVKLRETLKELTVNRDNEAVKNVHANHHKELCVITGVIKSTKDLIISRDSDIDGAEDLDLPVKIIDEAESIDLDRKKDLSQTVPANTPILYEVCPLHIHGNGSLELLTIRGEKGSVDVADTVDRPNKDVENIDESLKGLATIDKKLMESLFKEILADPWKAGPSRAAVKEKYLGHQSEIKDIPTIKAILQSDVSRNALESLMVVLSAVEGVVDTAEEAKGFTNVTGSVELCETMVRLYGVGEDRIGSVRVPDDQRDWLAVYGLLGEDRLTGEVWRSSLLSCYIVLHSVSEF